MKEEMGVRDLLKEALDVRVLPLSLSVQETARVFGFASEKPVRRLIDRNELRVLPRFKKPLRVTTESIISTAEGIYARNQR